MISELLIGLLFQSNLQAKMDSSFFSKPEVSTNQRNIQKPTPSRRPKSSATPTPTPTPKPSATLKPTATPTIKPSPSVKPAETSTAINTQSVLKALNDYRSKNGVGSLSLDDKLQSYAQSRADYLKSIGKLDNHEKHKEFMASDGFGKLGFNAVAENQGYNYQGDAAGLIEKFYGGSSGHNKNQLNSTYTHIGIGVNSPFTNLVFGGNKR